jgi:hypothetical protein
MGSKLQRFCLALLAALFLLVATLPQASANDLDAVLDDMKWGQSHEDVVKYAERKLMMEFELKAADVDTFKRDKLRQQYKQDAQKVAETYKVLAAGENSGLELSIVSGEFVKGNSESVLSMKDKVATRYYFFVNDQLYKVAVAYDPEYLSNVPFDEFLGSVAKKYGEQKELLEDDLGLLIEGTWEVGGTRLKVRNQSATYQAFLMTFTDIALENKVAAVHEKARQDRTGPSVSSEIDSLAMDGDSFIEDSGAEVKFNLMGSLTPEEAAAAEKQLNANATTDSKGGTTSGKGEKSAKKAGKPTKAERNLKGVQATKAGQDVIIY